jgi:hypothetical protein
MICYGGARGCREINNDDGKEEKNDGYVGIKRIPADDGH